jgi:hypothetical protein
LSLILMIWLVSSAISPITSLSGVAFHTHLLDGLPFVRLVVRLCEIGRNGFAEAKSDQGGGIRIDVIPWAGGRRSRAGTTN